MSPLPSVTVSHRFVGGVVRLLYPARPLPSRVLPLVLLTKVLCPADEVLYAADKGALSCHRVSFIVWRLSCLASVQVGGQASILTVEAI